VFYESKYYECICEFNESFFFVDFFGVEGELGALEDIAVTASGLAGPARNAGEESA